MGPPGRKSTRPPAASRKRTVRTRKAAAPRSTFPPNQNGRRLPENPPTHEPARVPADLPRRPPPGRHIADQDHRLAVGPQDSIVFAHYESIEKTDGLRVAQLLAEGRVGYQAVHGPVR